MTDNARSAAANLVLAAHERTKHMPDRYAPGPDALDWATRPDPFRRYEGAPIGNLDRVDDAPEPTYDSLFAGVRHGAPGPSRALVSRLLRDSLAISAWKRVSSGDTWAVRVNPSSGNLHPTEAYLLAGPIEGLSDSPALWHYRPLDHALEQLCAAHEAWSELAADLPEGAFLVALTSIPWRTAWKYGERALRYCQLDLGHAIGALALAARATGFDLQVAGAVPSGDLAAIVFGGESPTGPDAEHADVVLVASPSPAAPLPPGWRLAPRAVESLRRTPRAGTANQLSAAHREWPLIHDAMAAWRTPGDLALDAGAPAADGHRDGPDRGLPASRLFRSRRSAAAMDGVSRMTEAAFARLLGRLRGDRWPYSVLGVAPHAALALLVHRVEGLEPGIYLLPRDGALSAELRLALDPAFHWAPASGASGKQGLMLLATGEVQAAAGAVNAGQEITSDGAFAVAMLTRFGHVVGERPWMYPRLYWECGLIGQVLYVEAEAAGLRGTGIGCYFDDLVHRLLGLRDDAWQSLYHFTVGGYLQDPRLQTLPAYGELPAPGQ